MDPLGVTWGALGILGDQLESPRSALEPPGGRRGQFEAVDLGVRGSLFRCYKFLVQSVRVCSPCPLSSRLLLRFAGFLSVTGAVVGGRGVVAGILGESRGFGTLLGFFVDVVFWVGTAGIGFRLELDGNKKF